MPPLSQLPSDLKRGKFIKALQKVGFDVNTKGGKGSHIKITWPPTHKSLTIQDEFRKDVLSGVIKELEAISPITWDDIRKYL